MTFPSVDGSPWDVFQKRIKAAIVRASDEYQTIPELFLDLQICEAVLRDPALELDDEASFTNPVTMEIEIALARHAREDTIQFDAVSAANVVLDSMNALATGGQRL